MGQQDAVGRCTSCYVYRAIDMSCRHIISKPTGATIRRRRAVAAGVRRAGGGWELFWFFRLIVVMRGGMVAALLPTPQGPSLLLRSSEASRAVQQQI